MLLIRTIKKKQATITGFFLLIFLIALSSAKCQEIILNIKFESEGIIYLSEVVGAKTIHIDSLETNNKIQVVFNIREKPIGFYKISLNDTSSIDIIINNEALIELNLNSNILQNGIEVVQSSENKMLWEYKYYSRDYQQRKREFNKERLMYSESEKEFIELTKKIETLEGERKDKQQKIIQEFPESFLSLIIKASIKPHPSTGQTEKEVFFSSIDFSNPAIIRSSVLPGSIMEYLQKHTEYSEAGFRASIDHILTLAKQNPEVFDYCLSYLLDLFHNVGPEVVFDYLMEKYMLSNSCSEYIDEQYIPLMDNYQNTAIGKKIRNLSLDSPSKEATSLYSILSLQGEEKNILFFWSSHCTFCEEALIELSSKNSINANFIMFSLDTNESEWRKAIDKQGGISKQQFTDLKGWDSPVAKELNIHRTPYFIVLNSEGVITSKPSSVDELINLLER